MKKKMRVLKLQKVRSGNCVSFPWKTNIMACRGKLEEKIPAKERKKEKCRKCEESNLGKSCPLRKSARKVRTFRDKSSLHDYQKGQYHHSKFFGKKWMTRPALSQFKTSRPGDRQILCSSETSYKSTKAPKVVKRSVGQ